MRGIMRLFRAGTVAAAAWPFPAHAAAFDTGSDLRLRWDTTVRTSLGLRLDRADPALLADPNADDGDRAFTPGPMSERVDVLSELDLSLGKLGLDVSVDAWYDQSYHGTNANNSPATFNPVSVPHNRFPADVRSLQGADIDLLNASVHDTVSAAGHPITIRVGRQTLLWGESLFSTDNGIAAGQAPVDDIKSLSQPLAEAKELFLPVTQAVIDVQLSPSVHVQAYAQAEWRRDRIPGVASFFSTSDILDTGGERLFAGATVLTRAADNTPPDFGEGGIALHVATGALDLGLYALRFDAKSPQLSEPQAGRYALVFPRNIALYGASFSSYLGSANIAGEVSLRQHMPLVSAPPQFAAATTDYAAGDTLHGQASIVAVLPPGRLWQGATLSAELTANELLSVTRDPASLAPGRDRFASALQAVFSPQYFEVLPHLELTPSIGFGWNMIGNSSVLGDQLARTGEISIGLGATWHTVWQASLNATSFIGNPARQPLADRDFVTLSLSRTF